MAEKARLIDGDFYECPRCECSTVEVFDLDGLLSAFCRAPTCGWSGEAETDGEAATREAEEAEDRMNDTITDNALMDRAEGKGK